MDLNPSKFRVCDESLKLAILGLVPRCLGAFSKSIVAMGLTAPQGPDAYRMKYVDAGQLNIYYSIIFISCNLKREILQVVLK